MDNKELLKAIENIVDEKNKALEERLSKELKKNNQEIKDKIDYLDFKLDRTNEKLDALDLRVRMMEAYNKKEFRAIHDENDTMIEVLRQNELLPR